MDVDALIAGVFKRPPVWDKRHKLHSDRLVVDMCWSEISKEVDADKSNIKRKWKYLRDRFALEWKKLVNPKPSDSAETPLPPKWRFFSQLMFLKDIVQCRDVGSSFHGYNPKDNTFSILREPPDHADQVQQMKLEANSADDSESLDNNQDNDVEDIQSDYIEEEADYVSGKKRKRLFDDEYHQSCTTAANRKLDLLWERHVGRHVETSDEDLMFMKTLLPHIRRIPDHKKLRFRCRMQEVVEEFAYPESTTTTSSPTTMCHPSYSTDDVPHSSESSKRRHSDDQA